MSKRRIAEKKCTTVSVSAGAAPRRKNGNQSFKNSPAV